MKAWGRTDAIGAASVERRPGPRRRTSGLTPALAPERTPAECRSEPVVDLGSGLAAADGWAFGLASPLALQRFAESLAHVVLAGRVAVVAAVLTSVRCRFGRRGGRRGLGRAPASLEILTRHVSKPGMDCKSALRGAACRTFEPWLTTFRRHRAGTNRTVMTGMSRE